MCRKFKPNTIKGEEGPLLFNKGEIGYENVYRIEMDLFGETIISADRLSAPTHHGFL